MDYKELYELWLTNPYFDEDTRKELEAIKDDNKEIEDRFYKDLEFGTGGLRGTIGAGTNRMNIYTVAKASQGLSDYLVKSFTEPSVEVDISCHHCGGKGCAMCKGTGWIEILGAGMVNPKVLDMCGFDSKEYQGFAFGIGIERVAMLKYGIDNIRDFYNDDLRFLNQFQREE